jgi:hypothetical protein
MSRRQYEARRQADLAEATEEASGASNGGYSTIGLDGKPLPSGYVMSPSGIIMKASEAPPLTTAADKTSSNGQKVARVDGRDPKVARVGKTKRDGLPPPGQDPIPRYFICDQCSHDFWTSVNAGDKVNCFECDNIMNAEEGSNSEESGVVRYSRRTMSNGQENGEGAAPVVTISTVQLAHPEQDPELAALQAGLDDAMNDFINSGREET